MSAGQIYITGTAGPEIYGTSSTNTHVILGTSTVVPVAGTVETPAAGSAAGDTHMADTTQPTPPAPENMSISAEQFAALQTELAAEREARKVMAEQFVAEKRARRTEQVAARVESFTAVPRDGLVEKLMAVEDINPELASYFAGLLETMDAQVKQSALFGQRGSERKTPVNSDTLEALAARIHAEQFGGKPDKYEDAVAAAAAQRPDLFAAYSETYAPSRGR
jgi:hypothetical protein